MKKAEIRVGGLYNAKVNGMTQVVRVDEIREYNPSFGGFRQIGKAQMRYDVTNLRTGRRLTFRSAARFKEERATTN